MEAERARRWLAPSTAAAWSTTALFMATLSGQAAWEDRSTIAGGRWGHALAFDMVRGRTVLFGGRVVTTELADTWEWDGASWTQRSPAHTPPARNFHALAHDLARARTVLFGGANAAGAALADTWEWDGADWKQQFPAQ